MNEGTKVFYRAVGTYWRGGLQNSCWAAWEDAFKHYGEGLRSLINSKTLAPTSITIDFVPAICVRIEKIEIPYKNIEVKYWEEGNPKSKEEVNERK